MRTTPPSGRKYIAVGAGPAHTCAVTLANEAVCWGANNSGQVMPIPDGKYIAIAAGTGHSCAVTAGNEAVCWGADNAGQRMPPSRITPIAADPVTVTAAVANADRQQLSLSGGGVAVIPAGETRAILTVGVGDGYREGFTYDIDLDLAGPATLTESRVTAAVPDEKRVTNLRDVDGEAGGEVNENSPAGSTVGITVRADNAETYSLSDDADGRFAISTETGVVTVAMNVLDHEASPFHNITAQAANATNSRTATFVIRVADVPEPLRPVVDIDLSPNKIAFGSAPGDAVGITARAVDPDQGSAVTYSLSEDSTGLFTVSSQTGVVTLASGDYDPDQNYLIEVTAMPSDGGESRAAQFTVRRDDPVRIALTPTTATLAEGESQDVTFSFIETNLEAVAISAGFLHTCAVTADSRAVCWGTNEDNDGMPGGQTMPIPEGRYIAISAGTNQSCGITADNDAVCWGSRLIGDPPSDTKFTAISSGSDYNCGITPENDAICWGVNSSGQRIPPSNRKFIAISSGNVHTCAITTSDEAVCWGSNDDLRSTPPSDRKFIAISAGLSHSCGVTTDSEAICWGADGSGQSAPPSDKKFAAVAAGILHSCGITTDSEAVCWGDDSFGKRAVPADRKFIAISGGRDHTCGITVLNEVVCLGSDSFGITSPPRLAPFAADSIVISATVADADRERIIFRNNGRIVIPIRSVQAILTVTVRDDNIRELEADYPISLSVEGNATLEHDEVIITVPADGGDTEVIGDIDDAADEVAENSPVGAKVGIAVRTAATATYTLSDDAGGLFAIGSRSGAVSVAMDLLDHEAFSSHSITIQASGADSDTVVSFVIQVTDEDEPVSSITDIDLSPNKIAFGASQGASVGITAAAADPDQGSSVSYSLSESAGGLFAISTQTGVVTLASAAYDPERDYLIEVTARSSDGTSSAARFTVRQDGPIRIASSPATPTIIEGESRDIAFSFIRTDLEAKGISAGNAHTCAITASNDAVCWGSNSDGQTMPIPDGRYIALSAGNAHTCAITADNEAVCWGSNANNRERAARRRKVYGHQRRQRPHLRHHRR